MKKIKHEILLVSGTHGDEYQVIDSLNLYLKNNQSQLPSYLYIPRLSPSAVKAKTRVNQYGHDLNRQFQKITTDKEAKEVMKFLKNYQFNLCISFHEDPQMKNFYLYDSGKISKTIWQSFKKQLSKIKIKMYTGIDDETDPALGYFIKDGYYSYTKKDIKPNSATLTDWLIKERIVKRAQVPEIPGLAKHPLKNQIVEIIFDYLIIKLINDQKK